jgi:hypothetical protein
MIVLPNMEPCLRYLRATGYPATKPQSTTSKRLAFKSLVAWPGTYIAKLGREYEVAARDNFAWEAALFCVMDWLEPPGQQFMS